MNRIAITGSRGFVGSFLQKLLPVPQDMQYDILNHEREDITRSETCLDITSKADVVVHLAAMSGIKQCEDAPDQASLVNQQATITLAEESSQRGVRRFIFPSSSAVYGEAQDYSMTEKHPTEPRSVYGITKLNAEAILNLKRKDFEVVILRKSNLYGFGTCWKGITVIDKFLECYLKKQPMQINGTGSQKRDFVHIMDAVSLYAKLAEAKRVRSGIYNIGGNEAVSIRELAEKVNNIGQSTFGYRVPIQHTESRNEVLWHDFEYSSEKARMEFGYQPAFKIDFYIRERLLHELRNK